MHRFSLLPALPIPRTFGKSLMYGAIIIGGGFYGAAIAIYLTTRRGFSRVTIVEREQGLLTRASYNNQARVHNGYHYPRSFTTAFRSHVNLPQFVRDYPEAVMSDFTKIYAIAKRNSKVTARQFERFCWEIGARLEPAPQSLRALFEPRLIEAAYLVEKYAFDAGKLAVWARDELLHSGVGLRLGAQVKRISSLANGGLEARLETATGEAESLSARYVFNCTYSGLNQLAGDFAGTRTGLKHEITEIALMQVPPA